MHHSLVRTQICKRKDESDLICDCERVTENFDVSGKGRSINILWDTTLLIFDLVDFNLKWNKGGR